MNGNCAKPVTNQMLTAKYANGAVQNCAKTVRLGLLSVRDCSDDGVANGGAPKDAPPLLDLLPNDRNITMMKKNCGKVRFRSFPLTKFNIKYCQRWERITLL